MKDPINFEIETLVARYELHPDRQDVFVEGERDQGIVRAFLRKQGHGNVSVFSVSVVNIPPAVVLANSLPHPSRRSEVIALAKELEGNGIATRQVACIADSDFEIALPLNVKCTLLLLTDYTSMEMYAFSDEVIHGILTIVSPPTQTTGAQLIESFITPLQFLFSARAANNDLQLGLAWINKVEKFLSIKKGNVEFDDDEFLKRYVVIRVPAAILEGFNAKLKEIMAKPSPEIRSKIRGHDFVKLLAWYLRTKEKCGHLNEDSVRQMLYVAVRTEDLAKQPMFSSLLLRLGS
jgi:hypothetical protein